MRKKWILILVSTLAMFITIIIADRFFKSSNISDGWGLLQNYLYVLPLGLTITILSALVKRIDFVLVQILFLILPIVIGSFFIHYYFIVLLVSCIVFGYYTLITIKICKSR